MLKGMLHELELLESLKLSESDMPGAVAASQCLSSAEVVARLAMVISPHHQHATQEH